MEHKFNTPKIPFKNREEEITHLRRLIAEKEKNLEQIGLQKEEMVSAREVLAEYKRIPTKEVLNKDFVLPETEVEEIILKISPEEHDKQISKLVSLAKEKGVKNALVAVEKMQNFHITDDFHRFMAEYIKEGFTVPGMNTKEKIWKGLNTTLYEVLIPEEGKRVEGQAETLAQAISSMEQFYAGMLYI